MTKERVPFLYAPVTAPSLRNANTPFGNAPLRLLLIPLFYNPDIRNTMDERVVQVTTIIELFI